MPLAGSTSTASSAFSTMSRKRSTSALICSIFVAFSASSVMPAVSCMDPHFQRAAELDVGAAAGHVGRDRDRAGHAGFRDDIGFLLVEARVQHREQLCRLAGAGRGVKLLHRVFVAEIDLLVAVLLQIFGRALRISRSRRCRPAPAAAAHWRARPRPGSRHISRSGCDRPRRPRRAARPGTLVGISTTSSL